MWLRKIEYIWYYINNIKGEKIISEKQGKIIYSHSCPNSILEFVKPREKDFGSADIEASTFGQPYEDAIKHLNAFPFKVTDFLADYDELEPEELGHAKAIGTK